MKKQLTFFILLLSFSSLSLSQPPTAPGSSSNNRVGTYRAVAALGAVTATGYAGFKVAHRALKRRCFRPFTDSETGWNPLKHLYNYFFPYVTTRYQQYIALRSVIEKGNTAMVQVCETRGITDSLSSDVKAELMELALTTNNLAMVQACASSSITQSLHSFDSSELMKLALTTNNLAMVQACASSSITQSLNSFHSFYVIHNALQTKNPDMVTACTQSGIADRLSPVNAFNIMLRGLITENELMVAACTQSGIADRLSLLQSQIMKKALQTRNLDMVKAYTNDGKGWPFMKMALKTKDLGIIQALIKSNAVFINAYVRLFLKQETISESLYKTIISSIDDLSVNDSNVTKFAEHYTQLHSFEPQSEDVKLLIEAIKPLLELKYQEWKREQEAKWPTTDPMAVPDDIRNLINQFAGTVVPPSDE